MHQFLVARVFLVIQRLARFYVVHAQYLRPRQTCQRQEVACTSESALVVAM